MRGQRKHRGLRGIRKEPVQADRGYRQDGQLMHVPATGPM